MKQPRMRTADEPVQNLTERVLKTADDAPQVDDSALAGDLDDGDPQPPASTVPDGFHEMARAPQDGTLVELRFEDRSVHALWRITRVRDPGQRRWVPTGYWADPITREHVSGEPLGWRMPAGFAQPGMVV